jgi:hypothetical protein
MSFSNPNISYPRLGQRSSRTNFEERVPDFIIVTICGVLEGIAQLFKVGDDVASTQR